MAEKKKTDSKKAAPKKAVKLVDRPGMIEHIKNHSPYPTTKKALMSSCNDMADLPEPDRKWIIAKLPDGEYKTAADVLKAVGLDE